MKDPEENLGARMLREAAMRTGDAVGDGTTTATVLAHAIFAEGLRILRHALEAPARKIALNSGADAGVVVDRLRNETGAFGFDAAHGTDTDLIEAGIIDPTKVVRLALENAVSVAGTLLLAEAMLTEIEEKSDERAMPEPEIA